MNSICQRQLVGLFGFALVAVWIGLGTLATLLCLLASAGFYLGAARLQGRRRDQHADQYFQRTERSSRESNSDGPARLRRASSA
jgi:UPF0716 family protein affecting phage T7 exclusion